MPAIGGGAQITGSGQIADEIILSADIKDNEIVNADIKSSAAIARTKLDFGAGLVDADIAAGAAIALAKLATNPLARANHTGSQLASTISDFAAAVAALVSSTFPQQRIPLYTGTGAPGSNGFRFAAKNDGSVLFVADCPSGATTTTIYRLIKDTISGNYIVTHSTTLTVTADGLLGMAVCGNFLYVFATIAAAAAVRRCAIADLSGVTSMTGSLGALGAAFSDDTDLYTASAASQFTRYTISGTALTNAGNIAFTSAGTIQNVASDGTNAWTSPNFTGGTLTISKYAKAGGAALSTTTRLIAQAAMLDSGNGSQFFMASSTLLGIGWEFHETSATAVIGTSLHLMAITAP